MPTTLTRTVLGAVLAIAAGCEEEGIVTYSAPPDPPRQTAAVDPAAPMSGAMDGPVPAAPPGEVTLTWAVPEGWTPAADPPGFVLEAYDAGGPDSGVQATVSRLAGAGGGALANINRWRNQVGLPPVSDLPEQPAQALPTGDALPALVVDLVGEAGPGGEPTRVVAAILPREAANETWFFKLTGPRDRVEAVKPAFLELVASAAPTDSTGQPSTPAMP